MNKISSTALFAVLLLAFTFAPEDTTVIQVDNIKIGFHEFEDRLNDLPLPNGNKYSIDALKEDLASTLIAEAILACEAKKENLDSLFHLGLMSEEFHKEALYEQWMNSEVVSKIKISPNEIQKGYNRLKEIRDVDYWVLPNLRKADSLHEELAKGLDSKIKPQFKKMEYGQAFENIEDSVYGLNVGQLSEPIKVDNSYYVFRLIKKEQDPRYAKEDVGFYKPTIIQRIKSKKETYLISDKLKVLMRNKDYGIETGAYRYLVDKLEPIIFNSQLPKEGKANLIQQELSASAMKPDEMDKRPLIVFKNGKMWTVREVWEKLAASPYPLNYGTPKELKYGVQDVIKQIILLDSVAKDAEHKGYADSYYVQYQTQMWRNSLLAEALLDKFRESLQISEKDLFAFYDSTKSRHLQPERRKIISIVVNGKNSADKLYEQIKEGADILDLAQKYSLNKKDLDGQTPGVFITENMWGEAGKNAFKLEPGQIAPPLKVDDSDYAIIKLVEIKSAEPYPYEEIQDQLYTAYQNVKLQECVNDFLLKVVKDYDVKINKSALSNVQYFGGNMMVAKTHFPLRTAVPGVQFFSPTSPFLQPEGWDGLNSPILAGWYNYTQAKWFPQ
ncbi:MAG: peptidyl-prolyl cis-trans isomerase [Candidatus Kryptoniota bacterium]